MATPKSITITANTIAKDSPTDLTWRVNLSKGATFDVLAISPEKVAGHYKVTIRGYIFNNLNDGRNTFWLWEGHVLFATPGETGSEGTIKPGEFRLNSIAKKVIRHYEGLRLEAYPCSEEVWTVGIGTTMFRGAPVTPGITITEAEAWEQFERDTASTIRCINSVVETTLTGKQVAALTSFVYNSGNPQFEASTLLRLINSGGSHDAIAEQINRWTNGGLAGLVSRRADECRLWRGENPKLS